MPQSDKHNIRQAILAALQRKGRRPCEAPELIEELEIDGITAAEMRDELPGLIDHAYVENLMPGRGTLLQLTGKGRDQIRRDAALDEYIWGKDAFIR